MFFDIVINFQSGDLVLMLTCCPRLHAQAIESASCS